jgi:hypothetical protein
MQICRHFCFVAVRKVSISFRTDCFKGQSTIKTQLKVLRSLSDGNNRK